MGRLLIKRVVLIIPTIIIILIFSFLLKSLAPGDEVAQRMEIEGSGHALSMKDYFKVYREITEAYALDKPLFYFDIRPSYFPDTLQRIIPEGKKNLVLSILKQTKNWDQCDRFNRLLTQSLLITEREDQLVAIHRELQKTQLAKSLSDVKARLASISNSIEEGEEVPLEVADLISLVSNMKNTTPFSYPVISWNGVENQFHNWIFRIFSGRNTSLVDGRSSISKILEALRWTLFMTISSLFLVAIIALALGVIQVYLKGRFLDHFISIILFFLIAMPSFWIATLFVIFFTTPEYGSWTDIFPSIGLKPSFVKQSFLREVMNNLGQLVLPIICMTIGSISYLAIQLKEDLMDALRKPYVLMARAKGLSPKQVLFSHALPNALVPYITILTGAIPSVFSGSIIIEVIFNIPGVGKLLYSSMGLNDWPVVFTIIIIISSATILGYLLGDLLLMRLYPKAKIMATS